MIVIQISFRVRVRELFDEIREGSKQEKDKRHLSDFKSFFFIKEL